MAEVIVYGAVNAVIYAMLALGFALVFGVARILNLFHGSFYAIAAYLAWVLTGPGGLSPFAAAVLVVLLGAGFGALYDLVFVAPLRTQPIAILMMTLATALFTEQALLLIFGSQALSIPPLVEGPVTILGVNVGAQRLLMAVVGLTATLGLWLALNRTRLGVAILAVSQDPLGARLVGIPSERIFRIVFALSAALAAMAGVLAAPFLSVQPSMHLLPLVKAFAIVIVGGMGSLGGAILAAFLIAFTETAVAFWISASLSELVALVAVFAVLVLRPQGLFGVRART
jgi:branched-chain amino acid transport system permease protein